MFCTKCGKQLYDGDAFCAYCGTKVREELLQESTGRQRKYEEVVFNPPFRAEAERRTREISGEIAQPHSNEPKRETIHFDWNLDGFPTQASKRKEDFELNWEEVIEKKRELKPVNVEKIVPDNQIAEENKTEDIADIKEPVGELQKEKTEDIKQEDSLSIEDLERELFGDEEFKDDGVTIEYSRKDLEKDKEQQFYTYNAKRDAFQELLDKERERVESIESQIKARWEEITDNDLKLNLEEKEPPAFEDVFMEPKTPLAPPLREDSIALPPETLSVMADEQEQKETSEPKAVLINKNDNEIKESKAEEEIREQQAQTTALPEEGSVKKDEEPPKDTPVEETEEEVTPPFPGEDGEEKAKKKLRYSDVFPTDIFERDDDGNSDGGAALSDSKKEIAEDDEEEYKGNRIIKALIIILAIIVAVELVIIGVKMVAPDSGFSRTIDNITAKISGIFTGEDNTEDEPAVNTGSNSLDEYIREFANGATNIGVIYHDTALKYDLSRSYAFADIAQTQEYQNESSEGNGGSSPATQGRFVISAVISYYDSWKENNQDDELIGINKLDIGEIRVSGNGYYVLNRVTYAAADGQTVEKYETVYLQVEAEDVVVNEVKEESI